MGLVIRTWSISPICIVRSSTGRKTWAARSWIRPPTRCGHQSERQIERYDTLFSSENALEIGAKYDMIIDGTDNFPTRYLCERRVRAAEKPNVYGSIFRFEGQATVFAYPGGPCYRCLYPEPPPPALSRAALRAACWGFAGHYRADPSHRSREADPGRGRDSGWTLGVVRRPSDALP